MSLPRLLPVLVVMSALAGCAAETCKDHPCTANEKLVEAVRASIHEHSALLTDQIRVQAEDDGTVYLYGLVSTEVERREVEDVVKSTAGVKKVVNLCETENFQR